MSKLKISELFRSIQGESTYAGEPCTFIRLTGCNLRCSFCDTEYAYHGGEDKTVSELVAYAKKENAKIIEITGGEPLMQDGVLELSEKLLENGFTVLIETNGSLDVSVLNSNVIKIVDIKTPKSGAGDSFLMSNLSVLSPNDQLKFVISDEDDYIWSKEFVENNSPVAKIIFSPCWERMEPKTLANWIVADNLAVHFGLQLHKVIWGSETKGV